MKISEQERNISKGKRKMPSRPMCHSVPCELLCCLKLVIFSLMAPITSCLMKLFVS